MRTLGDIRNMLTAALGNAALVELVSTRVTLRTGVRLDGPDVQEDSDTGRVQQVLSALQDMGYSMQSLALVAEARRKGGSP